MLAKPRLHRLLSNWNEELSAIERQLLPVIAAPRPGIPVRAWVDNERVVVRAELPGVRREDIELTVKEDLLEIHARRSEPSAELRVLRRERPADAAHVSLRIPFPIANDRVVATHRDGILEIELPRSESDKPRRITVHGAAVDHQLHPSA
jgi:HSP20 family protein